MKRKPAPSRTNGPALLDHVAAFIGQYLSCSPDQLNLLALWVLHTHVFNTAPVTPYLNIHSRQKQSGKTLCLELLSLLCLKPWLHTAVPSSILRNQLEEEEFVGVLLLDDCQVTLGTSRSHVKAQGLFKVGSTNHGRHSFSYGEAREVHVLDLSVYAPKAFAGDGVLPPCLADISIPIALEPKKPGSPCRRFRFNHAQEAARPLVESITQWAVETDPRLENMAPYTEDRFPSELSSRQQDCAEPLLQIADLIGGEWPLRARRALVNVFTALAFEDPGASLQLLSDLRDVFSSAGQPWISTADLLHHLHNLNLHNPNSRPWREWHEGKPLEPSQLARLLAPFGINSRNHRTGQLSVVKGYDRQDFVKSWDCHLPLVPDPGCSGVAPVLTEHKVADPVCSGAAPEFAGRPVPDPTCSAVAPHFANHRVAGQACSGAAPEFAGRPVPDPTCSAVAPHVANHRVAGQACSGVAPEFTDRPVPDSTCSAVAPEFTDHPGQF